MHKVKKTAKKNKKPRILHMNIYSAKLHRCAAPISAMYLMNVAKVFPTPGSQILNNQPETSHECWKHVFGWHSKALFQISFPVCSEEWPKLNTNITKFKIQTLVICPIKMDWNIKKRALERYPKTCFWHKCEVSDWLFNFWLPEVGKTLTMSFQTILQLSAIIFQS